MLFDFCLLPNIFSNNYQFSSWLRYHYAPWKRSKTVTKASHENPSSNNHNTHPSMIDIQIGKRAESYILFCIAQFQTPSSHICLIYQQFPCYLVIEINCRLAVFLKKQIEALIQISSGTGNVLARTWCEERKISKYVTSTEYYHRIYYTMYPF